MKKSGKRWLPLTLTIKGFVHDKEAANLVGETLTDLAASLNTLIQKTVSQFNKLG